MMLDNVKILVGIQEGDTGKDALLALYITKTTQQVLNYCNLTELAPEMEGIVEDLVVMRYNRRGSEGVQSEMIGDRSKQFYVMGEDIPESVKTQLNRFRRMKMI